MTIVVEVNGLFIKYAPDKILVIEKAVEKNDIKALMVTAHSLKSSSAIFAAIQLQSLARNSKNGTFRAN